MTIHPGSAILTNGRLVLADRIVTGSIVVEDGVITAIDQGPSQAAGAIDLAGDYLLPGLVELHTDNLEKHFIPRPGTTWPALAAIVGHDAQVAAAGITTVFDALSVGEVSSGGDRLENLEGMTGAIREASARDMLRAEHFLHLRCEISHAGMARLFEPFLGDPLLKLVSVMDHTPGQRQFTTIESYRGYYVKKYGMTEEEFLAFVDRQLETSRLHGAANRALVIRLAKEHGLALASHDDATEAHVAESVEAGMEIADSVAPDAIILDMRMPITNGLQFLRLIRTKPHLVEVPVAIVTGDYFLADAIQNELRSLGASIRFKPMYLEDLLTLARPMVS